MCVEIDLALAAGLLGDCTVLQGDGVEDSGATDCSLQHVSAGLTVVGIQYIVYVPYVHLQQSTEY